MGKEKKEFNVEKWGYNKGESNNVLIPTMSVGYNHT